MIKNNKNVLKRGVLMWGNLLLKVLTQILHLSFLPMLPFSVLTKSFATHAVLAPTSTTVLYNSLWLSQWLQNVPFVFAANIHM